MITMVTRHVTGKYVVGVITMVTCHVTGEYVVGCDYHGNMSRYRGVCSHVCLPW